MASSVATIRSLVQRYKNLSESEVNVVYRNATHSLKEGGELTAATVKNLRQVVLVLSHGEQNIDLPEDLLLSLVKLICGGWTAPPTPQGGGRANPLVQHAAVMLSTAIVQTLIQSGIDSRISPTVYPKSQNTSALLAATFAMGRKDGHLSKLVAQMVQWISTVGFEYRVQSSALQYLVHTANLYRDIISEDQVFVISSQFSDWLTNASIEQTPNPSLKQKNRKPELVTEIDGGDCDDFFTILSLSQYYSPDQLMNIHTFSALRSWLQATFVKDLASSEDMGPTSTERKSVKKFSKKAKQALLDKACEYCLRVLDQCSRRPTRAHDVDIIHACATESILTLDLLCMLDPTLVQKLFPAIKTFHAGITEGSITYPRAALASLQFFINYSENVVFNAQPALENFFDKVVSHLFSDPFFAFDVVAFLRDNLEELCYKTFILERFFPNLLKILAWNPRTFLTDYLDILPAMTSQTTAIEIFHTLLDLPCTTATLELRKRRDLLQANPNLADLKPDWAKTAEALRKPENKPWFNFILRSRGGQGDTVNKLHVLHSLLSSMCTHTRVLYTAEAALVLLRVFFNTVHENADYDLMSHLLPIIIERTGLIYGIQGYKQEVHSILGEELLEIFRRHPALIVDQQRELLECLSTPKNMEGRETIFIQLVWIIGEYSSLSHDQRCTTELIQKYYETLEALFYENAMTLQASEEAITTTSVELIVTMMSTLAKLASQCQFLIPRVILCLTKVSQQMGRSTKVTSEEGAIILNRATQYVNLLKFPDIAGVILSPPEDIFSGYLHKDTHSSSVLLMRAAARLVE